MQQYETKTFKVSIDKWLKQRLSLVKKYTKEREMQLVPVISNILKNKRAEYGKNILTVLASKLERHYGNSFSERNLYRMSLFSERFSNLQILTPLASKLSWTHFTELLRVKSAEAMLYYANEVADRNLGTKELRHQISRKAYERREIANSQMTEKSAVPFNVFKDPYLLDVLGLKENFLEADLYLFLRGLY